MGRGLLCFWGRSFSVTACSAAGMSLLTEGDLRVAGDQGPLVIHEGHDKCALVMSALDHEPRVRGHQGPLVIQGGHDKPRFVVSPSDPASGAALVKGRGGHHKPGFVMSPSLDASTS